MWPGQKAFEMDYQALHYIDGKTHKESGSNTHTIYNPARGERIGETLIASQNLCDAAIASSLKAFDAWSLTPPGKRAKILFKFRDLIEKDQDALARLITQEQGKTHEDARGSILRAIEIIEFHCGLMSQLQGEMSTEVSSSLDCYTFRQPLGPCVGISPFNFPVMVPVWMMVPAIACGNTFILKPSEQDPSAALRLFELLSDAGLPAGVANCVQGDKTTVNYLITHPDIKACTAVASTPVAESIYKTAIAHGKRAHTFGGAKNHAVIMPDADMKQAAEALTGAAFGSAGERCMAISVAVVVGEDSARRLLRELVPLVKAIRIDEGNANKVNMGPLISRVHQAKVLSMVEKGIAEGAKLVVDGRQFVHPDYPDGFFMGPCLFDQVQSSMSIYQEEIFGPVLCLIKVNQLEEAIKLVNSHQYGNGTAIFTRDGFTAREYTHRVQVGMVGVNVPIPVPIANHPFGGWKRSYFGDIPMHGQKSIDFYMQYKTVTARWPVKDFSDHAFSMPVH